MFTSTPFFFLRFLIHHSLFIFYLISIFYSQFLSNLLSFPMEISHSIDRARVGEIVFFSFCYRHSRSGDKRVLGFLDLRRWQMLMSSSFKCSTRVPTSLRFFFLITRSAVFLTIIVPQRRHRSSHKLSLFLVENHRSASRRYFYENYLIKSFSRYYFFFTNL